jgi:pimeloyl-ACP methyl ester carboxylesterase
MLSTPKTEGDMPNRAVLDIQGVATPVVSAGPEADGEAVVCLHGNPGSSADWLDLTPRVAPFARIVAPDMPGFGDAAKPESFDYSVPGYTRHLTALLEAVNLRRAHLILHDFGVAWGLSWAVAHPERVASLTLVNIGVLPGYRWHWAARAWRTPVLGEAFMATTNRAGFRMLMKIGNPRGLPAAFVDGMYEHFDAGTRRAVLRLYRATPDVGALFTPHADAFRRWRIPVSVVWGAKDPYLPLRYAETQRNFFPAAEVNVFEDSGHWPHADNPERFAKVVVPFLKRARAGG